MSRSGLVVLIATKNRYDSLQSTTAYTRASDDVTRSTTFGNRERDEDHASSYPILSKGDVISSYLTQNWR